MKLSFFNIDKKQTDVLKGLAITLIVLHNLIHWTNGIGENEFEFDPNRINLLLGSIWANPLMFLNAIISYFGHFGVQIFIFISGYGLTKQYMKKDNISYWEYLVPRLIKIYALLIFGLIVYVLFFFDQWNIKSVVYLFASYLLIINNRSYDTMFQFPYIGPWWYFGMIMQLYVIYPFIYKVFNKFSNKDKAFVIMLGLTYLAIYLLFPITEKLNVPLMGSFLGHMPEFFLGIYLAQNERFKMTWKVFLSVLVIFGLSNKLSFFFPLSFLCSTILLLPVCTFIWKQTKGIVLNSLIFVGQISMFMFVINGPMRKLTLPFVEGHSPLYILMGAVVHLVLVIAVSYIMQVVYAKVFVPPTNGLSKWMLQKISKV